MAAVNWNDNTVHLRVYSLNGGDLHESCYDGNGWSAGSFPHQANTTAVAATSWFVNGTVFIRVYATDNNNHTKELCWDGNGWYVGAFSQSGSVTGVTSWYHNDHIFIRTYVNAGGSVKEYCWDANGPWYAGAFHS